MRALTVRQPWAAAIIHWGKTVENRTRNLAGSYRGPVAIHAGLTPDTAAQGSWPLGALIPMEAWRVRGAFVGVVDLVDVHQGPNTEGEPWRAVRSCFQPGKPYGACSRWAQSDAWHLTLANPRPLATPIPARGRLGLWTPEPDVVEQLEEAIR